MRLTANSIAFVGIMSALGIVLSIIAFMPLGPGINVDLSHIATFIVAVAGGSWLGGITGLIVGIYPMVQFNMNYLVPVGKALNGVVVGFLAKKTRPFFAIIVGWIAEAAVIFLTLGVWGIPYSLPGAVVQGILLKVTAEIVLLGVIVELLFRSKAVRLYIDRVFVQR